jgi:hypothetical protein
LIIPFKCGHRKNAACTIWILKILIKNPPKQSLGLLSKVCELQKKSNISVKKSLGYPRFWKPLENPRGLPMDFDSM